MSSICKHLTIGLIVLVMVVSSAVTAEAQWTVGYAPAYQTYYAPSATAYSSYYAPSAYQTYYAPSTAAYSTYYAPAAVAAAPVVQTSGWYPGYWIDRTRSALFGRRTVVVAGYPTTYAAGYPTTYAAGYPSTYVASYPSSYVASYPSNYVASYPSSYVASYPAVAAPACSSCVAPQQVTLRPACAPACSSCEPCTNCATTVSPVSYVEQASPACTNCATTAVSPEPTVASPQSTYGNDRPGLNPNSSVPTQREQNRVTTPDNTGGAANGGGAGTSAEGVSTGDGSTNSAAGRSTDPLDRFAPPPQKTEESANNLNVPEAPALFDPRDRVTKHSPAPIHMAVYKRPAGETRDSVSTQPISFEKAKRDAVGWTSAAK